MGRMKVLFLSAWYPHRYDAMAGLFVQKHAQAVSRFADVSVLFLYADNNITNLEIVENDVQNVHEVIVYYPKRSGILRKSFDYIRAFQKGFKEISSTWGTPEITHAHILTRTGVLAYLLQKKYGIPYVVTEQWSRYLPEKNTYAGLLRKSLTNIMIRNAKALLPVSQTLADAMNHVGIHSEHVVCVGNVVDDFFYEPLTKEERAKKRILHVSCFDESAKNLRGVLRVIQRLSDERFDFELIIIGSGPDFKEIRKEAHNFEILNTVVHFIGEQTPQQVSDWMHQSDFFLLFSNYETFATVIPEALASGIPVVSSAVGIAPTVITAKNGKLVPAGDEDALYTEINWMLDNYKSFDETEIRKSAQAFSFQAIGKQLVDVYQSAIVRS